MSTPPFPDMDGLLQRLLDDRLQPEEMARLQQAMRADSRVRDYYIDSMFVCAILRRSSQVIGEMSESDLIRALSDGGSRGGSPRILPHRYWIAAILILGLVIVTSLSLFRPRAQGPVMGVLTGAYEAQWQGARPRSGEPLYRGPYTLREGVAKMELEPGIDLLLEAPCQVELSSAHEVTLKSGRIDATVSSRAKGFRVRTPTALITDLGTEFGVIAHHDGSTEAHVLKGRILMALHPQSPQRTTPLVVEEGQAATVDTIGRTIRGGLVARADRFLRQVPFPGESADPAGRLSLADLVGGGNGRGTGGLDRGIDVGTGQVFRHPVTVISRARQNGYRPTPQYSGIDGVFVPNGPAEISSTGLVFSDCPRTTGSYFGGPANGGKFFDLLDQETHSARLNGVPVGTSRHPALSLHANAGITFDLDQIRRDHPDIEIDRFTALCGIPKDHPHPRFSAADVWILLDGEVRRSLRYTVEQDVFEQVDVPISAQTRFLTLVSSCPGRADYSWIIFSDPFLGPAVPVPAEVNR